MSGPFITPRYRFAAPSHLDIFMDGVSQADTSRILYYFLCKASRPTLYNDAPLNLLRTSCRKAAKSE